MRDVGVVLEVAGALGLAGPERAVQAAVVRERAEQELAECAGGLEVVGAVEPPRRLGQRREGEPVPGRDRLVVAQRLRAALADLEQPRALLVAQVTADDRAPVLERPQQLLAHAFLGRPREREPFHALGVSVLRGGEAAVDEPQLAEHVVERLLGHPPVALLARGRPGVEIRRGEECVVVQHLLEVRDQPVPVDGVPVEAATDEVVHPAAAIASSVVRTIGSASSSPRRCMRSRNSSVEACGNLGAPPQPPHSESNWRAEGAGRLAEHALRERIVRRCELGRTADGFDHRGRLARDVAAALPVRVRDRGQHLAEARQPVARLGRVVRPAEERLALGREEDRHRPAAVAGQPTTASM